MRVAFDDSGADGRVARRIATSELRGDKMNDKRRDRTEDATALSIRFLLQTEDGLLIRRLLETTQDLLGLERSEPESRFELHQTQIRQELSIDAIVAEPLCKVPQR